MMTLICYMLLSIVYCLLLAFILHSQWYNFSRPRTRDLHSDDEDHERYDIEVLVCFQLLYSAVHWCRCFFYIQAPSTILASMLIRSVSCSTSTSRLLFGFVGINTPSSCSILTVTPPFQPLSCSTSWAARTPYSLRIAFIYPWYLTIYGMYARLNIHTCQYAFLLINLLEGYVWYLRRPPFYCILQD